MDTERTLHASDRLRLIICGSVGDGKSTLAARLSHHPKALAADPITPAPESQRAQTQPADAVFGPLLDGAAAERDQGDAIGIVPRHFFSGPRAYSMAELPGHEQDTRRMIACASTADLAVVVVDARKGVLSETRRQTYLAALLGARSIVLAVNKLDLVDYSQAVFDRIVRDFCAYVRQLDMQDPVCVPLCALKGDNVSESSVHMPWYRGPTLMHCLQTVEVKPGAESTLTEAPGAADQFEATVIWTADSEMLPGRSYLLKSSASTVGVTLARPKYKLNVDTLEQLPARTLKPNEIGVCNLNLDRSILFEPYAVNRRTGGAILIDRLSGRPAGAVLLHFALRRATNLSWQSIEVDKQSHATLKGQKPAVLWFTGLSGAGKSTIANLVEKKLHSLGLHTYLLDGDNIRHGLNKDLGFTDADRVENIRRVAEVSRLMVDAGLIVLVSFISPFRAERRMARALVDKEEFFEVFVDTPISVAEARDPKGLYRRARAGQLANFTGVDSPYEPPENPEIRIDTTTTSAENAADRIVDVFRTAGILDR